MKATSLNGAPADSFAFKRILYTKKEFKATVTINRPESHNCFDHQTLTELGQAFLDVTYDDGIAVLIVTGAGEKAFCTGADLAEQDAFLRRPNDYYKWFHAFVEMHDRLRNIGKATIARLNGMVVGGGNELNMACDLAIAADHVTIRQVGAARGSVAAGGATQWLPMIIGDRRAREMLLLCESIDAYTALEWGLVNQVVPAAMLDSAVDAVAEKLRDKLVECTRYTKQQLNFWRDLSWGLTVGHARDWLSVHAASSEVKQGIASFKKKELPNYKQLRADLKKTGRGSCEACGENMPPGFSYCGKCGTELGN